MVKKVTMSVFALIFFATAGFCVNKINVLFCITSNYVPYAAVTITSLLETSRGECQYNIYLLCPNLDKTSKEILKAIVKPYKGNKCEFLDEDGLLSGVKSESKRAANFRLLAPKVLPQNVNKIIYADVDTVFNAPLTELWNIDVSDHYFAGVVDTIKTRKDFKNDEWERLKLYDISERGNYINSGVLVINNKKLREDTIVDELITFINNNADNLPYPDQDIINFMFENKILHIEPKYNWLVYDWGQDKGDAVIYHFAGPLKPWGNQKASWHLTQSENRKIYKSDLWWYFASMSYYCAYFLAEKSK